MSVPAVSELRITAENQFCEPLAVDPVGGCTISIIPESFSGTVTLQRRLPGQTTFQDITDETGAKKEFTSAVELDYVTFERTELILGVKPGDFSGTAVTVRLGRG